MIYKMSSLFGKTRRAVARDVELPSHKFLIQGGYIDMLSAGVYSLLPLGLRVHKKIENIIRDEMNKIGGQEIFMPALQPKALWDETGRYTEMAEAMFQFKDHAGKEMALGMTHEETITDLCRKNINSYRDLPFMAYQIQTKFRDEKRPRGGLLRTREFIMKDAYSFHADQKSLDQHYQEQVKAYNNIFKRCGLETVMVEASSGAMGGSVCHEFMLPSSIGEDEFRLCDCGYAANIEVEQKDSKCPSCKKNLKRQNGIELGHVFQLGTKYSEVMNAKFLDKDGKSIPVIMGCYGIGIGRLLSSVVESYNDSKGIIWPAEIAPFDIHMVVLDDSEEIQKEAKKALDILANNGFDILIDDRSETAGVKLNDADLLGMPIRIIISDKTIKDNKYEVKYRKEQKIEFIKSLDELNK